MNSWSLRNIIWWEFMLSFSILRRCRIWLHVAFFSAVCPVPHATWSFWRPSAGSSKDTLWPCSLWCSLLRLCGMAHPACCRFTFCTECTWIYMNLHLQYFWTASLIAGDGRLRRSPSGWASWHPRYMLQMHYASCRVKNIKEYQRMGNWWKLWAASFIMFLSLSHFNTFQLRCKVPYWSVASQSWNLRGSCCTPLAACRQSRTKPWWQQQWRSNLGTHDMAMDQYLWKYHF